MASEEFMQNVKWVDRLNLRLTYGINGNVSKESGPYLTVEDYGYNNWTGDFSNNIKSHPNPELRWEKDSCYEYRCRFFDFEFEVKRYDRLLYSQEYGFAGKSRYGSDVRMEQFEGELR